MGIEIPSTYVTVAPSAAEMNVASIVWGVSIAFFLFSAAKGVRQSWGIWKRTRTITAYVALIWMEWIVCVAMSPVLWFYIWGTIKPSYVAATQGAIRHTRLTYFPVNSFGLFFSILCLWTFQMQCVSIANNSKPRQARSTANMPAWRIDYPDHNQPDRASC